MVIVSRGMFDKAVREYANYAFPDRPDGKKWTYYAHGDRRIGAHDGVRCWLEDDIVREMSMCDGQKW